MQKNTVTPQESTRKMAYPLLVPSARDTLWSLFKATVHAAGRRSQSAIPILIPYAKHSLKPLQKRVTLSKGFVLLSLHSVAPKSHEWDMADWEHLPAV